MTNKKVGYKIQNSNGLFSTGGIKPDFSVTGKTWSTYESLKLHLSSGFYINVCYSDCKVVEVEEVIHNLEENLLQKIHERSIVQWCSRVPRNAEYQEMINALHIFVLDGICYSDEFKEFITQRKSDMIERYVPDYMIENFDIMHNKGIKGCSASELAAIMLTATPEQQELYNL